MNKSTVNSEKKPSFNLQLQYIRDISFENHNPVPFLKENDKSKFNTHLSVDVDHKELENDEYEVSLKASCILRNGEEKEVYRLEMDYVGLCRVQNATTELKNILLYVEAPRLLFPFVREKFQTLTGQSGFPPLVLNPIDFAGLMMHKMSQKDKSSAGA